MLLWLCKQVCMYYTNYVYILCVQEDTTLFQKYSIVFWEIYLDSVSNQRLNESKAD